MTTRATFLLVAAAGIAAAGLTACRQKNPAYEQALRNFDALANVPCPSEARGILAYQLKTKKDAARVLLYGPTGQRDATYYFAMLARDGGLLVGVFEEAQGRVIRQDYRTQFDADAFVWVMKCIRNDPPFSDRAIRYGRAVPVAVEPAPKYVRVRFVDGWVPTKKSWSRGEVTLNLAGTQLLSDDHDADFAFLPPPTAATAKP